MIVEDKGVLNQVVIIAAIIVAVVIAHGRGKDIGHERGRAEALAKHPDGVIHHIVKIEGELVKHSDRAAFMEDTDTPVDDYGLGAVIVNFRTDGEIDHCECFRR